jgi:hypothetical protein
MKSTFDMVFVAQDLRESIPSDRDLLSTAFSARRFAGSRWRRPLCALLCVRRGFCFASAFMAVILLGIMSTTVVARDYLVREGKPTSVISCGSQERAAADRLQLRIREWTGVSIPLQTQGEQPADGEFQILIGSPASHPTVQMALEGRELQSELGDEGLLIKTLTLGSRRTLLLAGATRQGAIFATGEFLNWHLRIENKNAWVEPVDVVLRPALPKRLMWSSVGGANWNPDFDKFQSSQSPSGLAAAIANESTYLDHTRWLIDFLSEHKFNGLIFWGLAGTATGGVEPGKKMSHYAKEAGIRVLPLIGTGIYSGFFHGDHPFNINTWSTSHPDARCVKQDGTPYGDSITPCNPESVKFFREGAEWLFTTFPDIGGVNLENGDWMSCWNDDCSAAKSLPENDPNFYWDMIASQRDIIEIGLRHQPDAWMTFATYTPFTEPLIRRDLTTAMKQKLAKAVVYPPHFLDQVDPRSIAQWTVSGMNGEAIWPANSGPPPGRLKHHIAFTHTNSFYGQKYDAARWWAEPNATFDESSPILFFQIPQAIKTGFEGFVIKGFVGDVSPANELFYLAAEELLWNPQSTPEAFLKNRLSVAYGGTERAEHFVKMLRNTTRDVAQIRSDEAAATSEERATQSDPRVSRRWHNLSKELGRRATIAQSRNAGSP